MADDDKKSSLLSKMGAMMDNAYRDGQIPKRWIWSWEFFEKWTIARLEQMDSMYFPTTHARAMYHISIGIPPRYPGIPFEVKSNTLHECELEVE